jgi:hypothetical protein
MEEMFQECLQSVPFHSEQETRIGTELAYAEGDGVGEFCGNSFGTTFKGMIK